MTSTLNSIEQMESGIPPSQAARPVTPVSILVSHLQSALQIVENTPTLPQELAIELQSALALAAGLDRYVDEQTTPASEALAAIAQATHQEQWDDRFSTGTTVRPLEQEMLSGHVEGQLLKMIVALTGAKRVLDIGMFTGYSALAMAEALPEDGVLVACEVDPFVAEFAQTFFQDSPHGHKIQVQLGTALETLHTLAARSQSFDLVFIDADKQEYTQYFQQLLDSTLLSPQGCICVDNTLFQGQVYLPEQARSQSGQAIATFNQVVAEDSRVEQVLLPVRDGLTIIRRVS